ncbi:MAG: ATP-binding protein [Myxococcales bacterium]|nr:ATP-binding protein [Myxococcales bacterium]
MSQKRIVLTGGPGAGKTAVLEIVRIVFGDAVTLLPESASILFGGGFPRRDVPVARRAAQRAIYRVQRELELMAEEEAATPTALCDRGTLDGLAYWPGDVAEFWAQVGTTHEAELSRYVGVIHLRSPSLHHGYNHKNPVRTENAEEAARIDARIYEAWSAHPARIVIESEDQFVDKVDAALHAVRDFLKTNGVT